MQNSKNVNHHKYGKHYLSDANSKIEYCSTKDISVLGFLFYSSFRAQF